MRRLDTVESFPNTRIITNPTSQQFNMEDLGINIINILSKMICDSNDDEKYKNSIADLKAENLLYDRNKNIVYIIDPRADKMRDK